jgi:hypothetical protein
MKINLHFLKSDYILKKLSLYFFIFTAFGCAKKITHRNFPHEEIIPSTNTHLLTIYNNRTPAEVLYLGCGHLAIRFHNEIILIDPFFSTSGFTDTQVASNTAAFEKYKTILATHRMDLSETKSIWIAHTHYDHMMDLPLMLRKNVLPKETVIHGNAFGDDILKNFISAGQYHSLEASEVYDPEKTDNKGTWFNTSSSIRVMPIRSDHAPHYKLLGIPFHLMKGELKPDYFESALKEEYDKTKRSCWREGTTYSFLVDFMEKDSIVFRFFIQTSGSHFPLGRPPEELLKDRPVDVAFLCAASANFVKPYPVDILNMLKPKRTVFIHWEDFFREPLDFDGARFVRLSNFRKLNRRLKRNGYALNKENYVMPRPGTLITVR